MPRGKKGHPCPLHSHAILTKQNACCVTCTVLNVLLVKSVKRVVGVVGNSVKVKHVDSGKKRMCCYFQCSCDVLGTMGLLKCLTVAARLFLKNGGAAQFISEPNVQFIACMQSSRHHEVMTSRDQKWIANYTACTE